jgi:receptor protein-tyrosine kinase
MEPQVDPQEEQLETVDLADLLRVVRERWVWVALVVALMVTAALAYSLRQDPVYQTAAEVVYEPPVLEGSILGTQLLPSTPTDRKLETGARLIASREIAERVKDDLQSPHSAAELLAMVDVAAEENSDIIRIQARSGDPEEAVRVADGFAHAFVEARSEVVADLLGKQKQVLQSQIDAVPEEESLVDYALGLKTRLQQIETLEDLATADYRVLETALVPESPVAPQPLRNAILALAVGLVLGLGLAFLLDHLDRRIKDEAGMEREFGLPVLASIPALGGRWMKRGSGGAGQAASAAIGFSESTSPLLEPFRTLRSNLQYLNVDTNMRTIMISSALPQEGKTVTTVNLALSLALSGERVIVIEADLRRPRLHHYLGLTNEVGVTSVLAGQSSFSEAMQLVETENFVPQEGSSPASAGLSRNLYCICSGPLPPNPAELAGSQRMQSLLEKAAESADYVLVDSPPLLLVSDGLSLAKQVDGVILTALANKTTRDEARQVTSMLERVGARPVGVVAAGIKPRRGSPYYRYGYYQEQPVE